jgi:hypothetical protein
MSPTAAMSTEHELRAVRALPNSPFVLLSRRRLAAPLARRQRRALPWARPAHAGPRFANMQIMADLVRASDVRRSA